MHVAATSGSYRFDCRQMSDSQSALVDCLEVARSPHHIAQLLSQHHILHLVEVKQAYICLADILMPVLAAVETWPRLFAAGKRSWKDPSTYVPSTLSVSLVRGQPALQNH